MREVCNKHISDYLIDPKTLREHGFELRRDVMPKLDLMDEEQILHRYISISFVRLPIFLHLPDFHSCCGHRYYPYCEELIKRAVPGATHVFAVDHNVRCDASPRCPGILPPLLWLLLSPEPIMLTRNNPHARWLVRCKGAQEAGEKIKGGNRVQGPALVVHGDYTLHRCIPSA